jgi:hypothetical protein
MADPVSATLAVASTAISAYGSHQKGKAESRAADFEAAQMQANASRVAEEGIKRAEEQRRNKRVALSDARAAQAAGGGTTTDAGALGQLGSLSAAFERNALEELYQSKLDARGIQLQAAARKFEGKMAKRAGNMAALSTVLSGGKSIYDSSRGGMSSFTAPAPAARGPVVTAVPSWTTPRPTRRAF